MVIALAGLLAHPVLAQTGKLNDLKKSSLVVYRSDSVTTFSILVERK
jgi:hypothetical protein